MNPAIRLVATGMMLIATLPAALAQPNYPTQPVRVIVTTAPGGGLDTFARLVAREFSERAGQQFVVDNRPGAGTTIGSAAVARAKPDGYTVLLNTSSFAISPAIYQKLPYDPLRDFAPITMSSVMPHVRAGKLRALGVSSARRAAAAPGIPTIAEAGVPGYESAQWYGLFAPAGTPQEIIAWLHREATAILRATNITNGSQD